MFAFRPVDITVQLEGKTVLSCLRKDDGYPRPYTVWRYLKSVPLRPVEGFNLQLEPGRPLEAVLRGKLLVTVRYGALVEATELKLTRKQESLNEWYLDPTWIESNAPPSDEAEEARWLTERRKQRSEEENAYRFWALVAAGGAAASWAACLIAMGRLFTGKRGRILAWSRLATLVFCGLAVAVVCVFTGNPFVDQQELTYRDIRLSAFYAGLTSGGLVLIAWLVGYWRSRPSEPSAQANPSHG